MKKVLLAIWVSFLLAGCSGPETPDLQSIGEQPKEQPTVQDSEKISITF